MRIIALINQKGGVGKTTTAVNLGCGLARLGRKVLLVDIDPQANLSLHLNVDVFKAPGSIYDLLLGRTSIGDIVLPTGEEGVEIVPSHIDLCSAELELVNTVGREVLLRDALRQYVEAADAPPDYILIDCPPSLGLLSLNALSAAQEVVVPIQAEFFALQGMGKLVEVVNLVKARLNPGLRISGIVICMYRSQTTLAKEVLNEVERFFGEVVFKTKIRQNIRLAEAPGHGQSIFAYDPGSNGALDYMALAREAAGEPLAETLEEPAEDASEPLAETIEESVEDAPEVPVESGILDAKEKIPPEVLPTEPARDEENRSSGEEEDVQDGAPPMEGHSRTLEAGGS